MDKIIYIDYEDKNLECIIEYTMVGESSYDDKFLYPEVTNVYLPDDCQAMGVGERYALRQKALIEFHNNV